MSEYVIINGELHHCDDELYHYGVKGMRWGVRRASKKLSKATTQEQRDKAISKLNKHREKGTAKIEKLKKKTSKLEDRAADAELENSRKAADYRAKSAYYKQRAYERFRTKSSRQEQLAYAEKYAAQAEYLENSASRAKANLEHNKRMIAAFEKEIKNIDQALIDAGKRRVPG